MNTNTSVASTSTPQKKEITDISSMLLPLADRYLLLPGVAVAEIVTFVPPEPENDEETPAWFLGHIYWRNQRLPLIAYESMLTGENPHMSSRCRIAVMNNTGLSHQLPFFAIVLKATPRLLRLAPKDIVIIEEKEISSGEKMHVQVVGEKAVVPDVAFMEKSIINYLELA
jgi:chemosensory pili system protein ChpC